MWNKIRAVWQELTTPDDFSDDWFKWSAGQAGHFVQGLMVALFITVLHDHFYGEAPYKYQIFIVAGASYLLFELTFHGWQKWDTIEDWVFFSLYGAGGGILSVSEIAPSDYDIDLKTAGLVFVAMVGHLLMGVAKRLR
jgi:hypothetical protein